MADVSVGSELQAASSARLAAATMRGSDQGVCTFIENLAWY